MNTDMTACHMWFVLGIYKRNQEKANNMTALSCEDSH